MITIGFGVFVTGFLVIGLLFFVALWIYYDRRDHLFYDRQRTRHVHHCVKCGTLYASRADSGTEACPQCGFRNASLRF
ncbi:MAG: hydrogenase nickel incorporation protein HypA [Puniceicoccaceae bacterium]